jgi:Holliday junction resolvasome RuvABC endonuclease subunit
MALGGDMVPPRSLQAALPGPVWGIDPSVERVALGIVARDRIEAHTLSLAQGGQHPGVRLAKARAELVDWMRALAEGAGVPVAVALEEPYGGAKTQTPVQSYMLCGAIMAAVHDAFGERAQVIRQPRERGGWSHIGVGPASWKAAAMGAGNGFAKKPAITAWAMGACGWAGPSRERPQDEADALGIATWAALQVVAAS